MDRLETLRSVKAGTVTARAQNAAGSRALYEPKEATVSMRFLTRAGLVREERSKNHHESVICTLTVTERGEDVLARATA